MYARVVLADQSREVVWSQVVCRARPKRGDSQPLRTGGQMLGRAGTRLAAAGFSGTFIEIRLPSPYSRRF